MSGRLCPRPLGRDIRVPIRQLIREQRMKIEEAEWNGQVQGSWYYNFLLSEQKRGVTMVTVGWEAIDYEKS